MSNKVKKFWAIDLGTSNSAIAFSTDKKTTNIEMYMGQDVLPSIVSEENGELKVVKKRTTNMYDFKNGGKVYSNWKMNNMKSPLAFKPFKNSKNYDATPISLSAIVLKELIQTAENKTGETIKKIAVTIPANFNEDERKNTLEAIKDVREFEEVKLIHEPTAAAISLLEKYKVEKIVDKKILVFDIGAGTTDISLLDFKLKSNAIKAKIYETIGMNVAGNDIDQLILEKFVYKEVLSVLKTNISKLKIQDNYETLNETLKLHAELIKVNLANTEGNISTVINLEWKGKNKQVIVNVSYKEFDLLINDLFKGHIKMIQKIIDNNKISKDDISWVVLAGGSSRGPWITKIINKFFKRTVILEVNNPTLSIVNGASIIAGMDFTKGVFKYKGNDLKIQEIIPNNIGIRLSCGKVSWFLDKGTKIPAVHVKENMALTDAIFNQEHIDIIFYESKEKVFFANEANIFGIARIKNNFKSSKLKIEVKYDSDMKVGFIIEQGGEKIKPKIITYSKEFDEVKRMVNQNDLELLNKFNSFIRKKKVAKRMLSRETLNTLLAELEKDGANLKQYEDVVINSDEHKILLARYMYYSNAIKDMVVDENKTLHCNVF